MKKEEKVMTSAQVFVDDNKELIRIKNSNKKKFSSVAMVIHALLEKNKGKEV